MNSRRICAETRGGGAAAPRHGNRVGFPDFPRNREADDGARDPCISAIAASGREKELREDEAKSGDLFAP